MSSILHVTDCPPAQGSERRMNRLLAAAVPLLAACSASAASDAEFRPLPLPAETFAVPQAVFASALEGFPEGREGRQELDLSVRKQEDGTYVAVLTRSGFLDDSVNGDQQRAVLARVDGGWRATSLGERWRCQSGRGPAGWTTRPCH